MSTQGDKINPTNANTKTVIIDSHQPTLKFQIITTF